MTPTDLGLEILVVIFAAVIGAAAFERLRLPAVAGLLVVGAIVGPGGLGLVEDPDRVRALAEFGVALLLFQIGLELPIATLRRVWRMAALSGALQVSLTVAGVAALAAAVGVRVETAIVMGMLVSLSSTALVMRVLAQRGEVDAPHGRLSVGILLFQDLCLVPFLLALPILSGEVPRQPEPLALAIGQDLLALAVLFGAARFLLPWVLERVARLRSPDLFSLFAFLMAIGSALVAEEMGLTLAVGAFIAGLVVSASPYAHQLFAEVVPLRGVLLGIFFTAVGMLFDPGAALGAWRGILLFVGGVVILKTGIIVAVLTLVLRQGLRIGILTGLGLAQTGEFSFVLAEAATPSGLLDESLRQIFVAGSVLTLDRHAVSGARCAAPRAGAGGRHRAAGPGSRRRDGGRRRRRPRRHRRLRPGGSHARARPQGLGHPVPRGGPERRLGRRSPGARRARDLRRRDARRDPGAPRRGAREAGVHRDQRSRGHPALHLRSCAHSHPTSGSWSGRATCRIWTSSSPRARRRSWRRSSNPRIDLFSKVLRSFGIPHEAITHFAEAMRMEGYEFTRAAGELPIDPWLAELLQEVATEWVDVPEGWEGERTILELGIRSRTGANILAVRRGGATTPNPPPGFAIRAGDSLLVLASPTGLRQLRELLANAG